MNAVLKPFPVSAVDSLLNAAGLQPTYSTNTSVSVRILRIGPPEAAALLAANKDNRPLRQGRVRFYARTMKAGGWKLTHQGIAFCIDGRALDLQHRMHAIIESGLTVDMMVTEGLSAEAFDAIDQHERRSVADSLRIDRALTEEAKFFLSLRGITSPTLLEIGEVSGFIEPQHNFLRSVCATATKIYSSVPMRCAAEVLMLERPAISETVAQKYRDLVLLRTDQFSPAMQALDRQVRSGAVSTSRGSARLDLFCRALAALDPARNCLSKIQVNEGTVEVARARAVSVLAPVLGKAEDD